MAVNDPSVASAEGQFTTSKRPFNWGRDIRRERGSAGAGACPVAHIPLLRVLVAAVPRADAAAAALGATMPGMDSTPMVTECRPEGSPRPCSSYSFNTTNENGLRRSRKSLVFLVGGAGFEPATPAV